MKFYSEIKALNVHKVGRFEDGYFETDDEKHIEILSRVPEASPITEPEPAADEDRTVIVSEKITDALMEAGYVDVLDVLSATDEELLSVKGIGKSALEKIRELGEPVEDENNDASI